jgi:acyl-CoA thioesterase
VGDFVAETALEPIGERRYRAVLSPAWTLWGPAGGYVSAIALRAAGAAKSFRRPVSYACQYLTVARFDAVELAVDSLRVGKRSEALRITMTQAGKPILAAQVWAIDDGHEGMVHDFVQAPALPHPDALKSMEELRPDRPQHPFLRNFEQRPLDWVPDEDRTPGEPELRGFYRFRPRAVADDPFVDAARAVILIDTFTWPATYRAHPSADPSPWIAPNLDLYVRFHRETSAHEWLYCVGRADLAEAGLIAAHGAVFSPEGKLLASGSTQLLCSPRPAQFR